MIGLSESRRLDDNLYLTLNLNIYKEFIQPIVVYDMYKGNKSKKLQRILATSYLHLDHILQ